MSEERGGAVERGSETWDGVKKLTCGAETMVRGDGVTAVYEAKSHSWVELEAGDTVTWEAGPGGVAMYAVEKAGPTTVEEDLWASAGPSEGEATPSGGREGHGRRGSGRRSW